MLVSVSGRLCASLCILCLLGSAYGCWCFSQHAAFPGLWAHVHMRCSGTVPVIVRSKAYLCVHKVHMSSQACAPATGMTGQCVRFPVTSSPSTLEAGFLCSFPSLFPGILTAPLH